MATAATPNTSDVARRLGVTRAAVSRWRSGSRLPQLAQRQKIEAAYGWGIADQALAEAAGTWAEAFNSMLERVEITA